MNLKIKKLYEDAKIPTRAHKEDAGIDVYSQRTHVVEAHTTSAIPVGVAMEIPVGCVGLIWDKSGIGLKGIKTLGGVVDAGFRGEVKVILHNLNDVPYTFSHGDIGAQMLIQKVELCDVEEVQDLSDAARGEKAFGSTGK